MDKRQGLGITGAIILFLGIFAPAFRAPIIQNINYFQTDAFGGTIIIAMSVISFVLVLFEKYKGLWFTGFASLCAVIFTFINSKELIFSVLKAQWTEVNITWGVNLFDGSENLVLQNIKSEWGLGVLIAGSLLLILVAAIDLNENKN